jgi:putative FmdB family regulatory protein
LRKKDRPFGPLLDRGFSRIQNNGGDRMILHEFHCKQCDNQFEEMVSSNEETPHCPSCGSREVKRLLSAVKRTGGNADPDALGNACGPVGGFS